MIPILVVGGAGYIGSHTCLDLFEKGFKPIVYDNLTNGHAEFVQWGPLEIGDIRDGERLETVIANHKPGRKTELKNGLWIGRLEMISNGQIRHFKTGCV